MNTNKEYHQKFEDHRCCVLIPTYNNASTLDRVLQGVIEYTSNILVINDGSTDTTTSILANYSSLHILHLGRNKGKGNALRKGFLEAQELGYEYAISIDSDGQLFPDDLPVFLNALEARKENGPELLVVGSRKMDDPSVPGKSSLGNRFSSFWFWVETGVRLEDTQCGFRLYPIRIVNSLHLFTSRYELEIEVLVKAAWAGVQVVNLPVKVLYDPTERVTHFQPFQDVFRITLLNIYFLTYGLLVVAPRALYRKITGTSHQEKENLLQKEQVQLKTGS